MQKNNILKFIGLLTALLLLAILTVIIISLKKSSSVETLAIPSFPTEQASTGLEKEPMRMKPSYIISNSKMAASAWAVDIGIYANKLTAFKIANHLRSLGYRAVMHAVKTVSVEPKFYVFIGPEFQHASAIALAKKIANHTSLHPRIIAYNPLVL